MAALVLRGVKTVSSNFLTLIRNSVICKSFTNNVLTGIWECRDSERARMLTGRSAYFSFFLQSLKCDLSCLKILEETLLCENIYFFEN